MKRLYIGLFLFCITAILYSLEVQIPFYFVHINNFLSGTMIGTYNDRRILEMEHSENVFGMGGGIGADFYFAKRSRWWGDGIYLRINYYNPYHVKTSNTKITTSTGSITPFSNSERDIDNSFSFDLSIGSILRLKYKSFEFPLVFAIVFPRVSKIDMESDDLGKEGVADFGILFDIGVRYFFMGRYFATIGGRYGIGIGLAGFPDAKFPSGVDITDLFFPSQIVAGYIGLGIKL
jgi:hypothetical protein